jgi:hypothetical protein
MPRLWLSIFPAWFATCAAGVLSQEKQPAPVVVADADVISWVDARVKERTPAAEDRRFDEIGWAKDIRDALRLAKEHNRPVFLFSHDGRMNLGRC